MDSSNTFIYDYLNADKLNPPIEFSNIDNVIDQAKHSEIIQFNNNLIQESEIIKSRCDKFMDEVNDISKVIEEMKNKIELENK